MFQSTQEFHNCTVKWDTTLNSYSLLVNQPCKNIKQLQYGRRLGNIHYKEDSWYIVIEPLLYREKFRITLPTDTKGYTENFTKEAFHDRADVATTDASGDLDNSYYIYKWGKWKSARIRDKYCKIRVKYTGKDLVIITALKTLYTISYA